MGKDCYTSPVIQRITCWGSHCNYLISTDAQMFKLNIQTPLKKCSYNHWQWFIMVNLNFCFKIPNLGLHGGSVVENLPASSGDTGGVPGLGWFHMPRSSEARVPQLLSLCSAAREPQPLKSECSGAGSLQLEKPPQWEALALPTGG